MLASVPACPLGVPHSLRKFAFKTARALVAAPQTPGALGEEVALVRTPLSMSVVCECVRACVCVRGCLCACACVTRVSDSVCVSV